MTQEHETESQTTIRDETELAPASIYLRSRTTQRATTAVLLQEMRTVGTLVVPAFADEVQIDFFEGGETTQRYAKFASDDLVFAASTSKSAHERDPVHSIKLPLTSGRGFLGSLLVTRLATSKPFSEHERSKVKVLANLVSTRMAASIAPPPELDHELLTDQSLRGQESCNARLHRLCGVLAHELRNPLSVFRTTVDLIENESQSCEQLKGMLNLQIERMTHLVDDLLDLSRFTNGKVRLEKAPTQLQAIINTALQSMQFTLAAKQQQVLTNMTSDGHSTWIDADRFRLTQVMINLLSNASKFSDDGDSIHLDVLTNGDNVEIHVSDQGIGIAPDELPNIFEFFSQSQSINSLDHSGDGLGIGLGLVKGLIEMHEGSVTAHSDGEDKGSTFIVRLPVCEPIAITPTAQQSPFHSICRRVMIVDDRRDNAYLLQALANRLGAEETRCASDGPLALEALSDFVPDLILLDLGLPGMSGLELAREIRKLSHCCTTFIVALTGYDDLEMRQAADAAGIDLYRRKPVSLDMLRDVFWRVSKDRRNNRWRKLPACD